MEYELPEQMLPLVTATVGVVKTVSVENTVLVAAQPEVAPVIV
jgi:hypothetical protein